MRQPLKGFGLEAMLVSDRPQGVPILTCRYLPTTNRQDVGVTGFSGIAHLVDPISQWADPLP